MGEPQNRHRNFDNSVYRSRYAHTLPRPTTSYGEMQSEAAFIKKEHHTRGKREKVAYFLIGFF